jgi:hypothetical protein
LSTASGKIEGPAEKLYTLSIKLSSRVKTKKSNKPVLFIKKIDYSLFYHIYKEKGKDLKGKIRIFLHKKILFLLTS